MKQLTKQEIKSFIKNIIKEKNPDLLNYLTQDRINRVQDYYLGCSHIFNLMAEKPINNDEMEDFSKKLVFDFFNTTI